MAACALNLSILVVFKLRYEKMGKSVMNVEVPKLNFI